MSRDISCTMLLGSVCIRAVVAGEWRKRQEVEGRRRRRQPRHHDHIRLHSNSSTTRVETRRTSSTQTPFTTNTFSANARINRGNMRPFCIQPDLLHRGRSIYRDLADNLNSVMLRHNVVRPSLCARRQSPERKSALQAQLGPVTTFYGPNNRSFAVYEDRVYVGTLDAKIVALDAITALSFWEEQVAILKKGYSGSNPDDRGRWQESDRHQRRRVRHPRLRQGLRRRGKLIWSFDTIPELRRRFGDDDATGRDERRDMAAEKSRASRRMATLRNAGGGVWQNRSRSTSRRSRSLRRRAIRRRVDGSVRPATTSIPTRWSRSIDTGDCVSRFQYIPHDVSRYPTPSARPSWSTRRTVLQEARSSRFCTPARPLHLRARRLAAASCGTRLRSWMQKGRWRCQRQPDLLPTPDYSENTRGGVAASRWSPFPTTSGPPTWPIRINLRRR